MARPARPANAERYHHGDLRQALLDAGLEMLTAGEELTLRAVARRAGVSHAAPYYHFPDRRALIAAIAAEGLLALRDALDLAVNLHADAPPLQFYEIGVAYVRFAVENPARFRLMFSAELADRQDLPDLQDAYDRAYDVLFQAARRVGGGGAADPAVSTRALAAWSQVHGLAMLILDNQVGQAPGTDEAVAIARAVLMVGSTPADRRA